MITTLIIEDDKHTIAMLTDIIKTNFIDIEILGDASTIKEGTALIAEMKPNVIFLDVNLEDGKSFEILKQFPNPDFKIIFITSYSKYAIEAFKFSALDFVLKPFTAIDIVEAINKVISYFTKDNYNKKIETFFHNYSSSQKKIVLSNSDNIHVVRLEEIIYASSDNNYTTFYISDGREILISKPLKHYEEKLESYHFFRIHQSHLINLNFIKQYDKRQDKIVLTNNTLLPVAQSKKSHLLAILSK